MRPKRPLPDFRIMTMQDYRAKFLQELTDKKLLNHFDRSTGQDGLMLSFPENEWVPGHAWPGNYGRVVITDYSTYKVRKGRRKIVIAEGITDYEDWEGMDDLVPYALPTTAQNIERAVAKKRVSFYNLPYRFGEKYKERLLVTIAGTLAQGSDLTEEMLAEALAEMTPFERSKYEQSLFKIDVSLYPSVEQPVRVRIDGIDDGAEEALFADMATAMNALEEIARWNNRTTRSDHGFQLED